MVMVLNFVILLAVQAMKFLIQELKKVALHGDGVDFLEVSFSCNRCDTFIKHSFMDQLIA